MSLRQYFLRYNNGMLKIIVKEITEKKIWEDFLAQHPEANFLQSWNWGQFYLKLGQKVFYRGFYRGEELQGVMLLIREDAKRGRHLILPGGPIFEWYDQDLIKAFGEELRRLGKQEKAVFIRCRPQLQDNEKSRRIFADLGFVDAPMHLHAELTHRLDLTLSEEELLAKMRKSTRYEIRKAAKEGIKVTAFQQGAEQNIEEEIKKFHQLQLETAQRQKFVPFSLQYWEKQFEAFWDDKEVILYSAYYQNELLAQAMIIFYGQEAVYHYGASTELARKYPGAPAIQWEAIQEAKRRGMTRYNFWGVAPEDEKEHRFAKLSVFKRGFAGEDFAYLHAQDLVIAAGAYKLNLVVEKVRKKIRKV